MTKLPVESIIIGVLWFNISSQKMKTFYSILNEQANTFWWHVMRHSKIFWSHIRKHHRKYIFWAVGSALLIKAITVILAWVWIGYSINNDTFADNEWEYCYLTGQYLTGWYETWCYLTGQYLTEWTMTGCYMEGQYLTGWTLDEEWNLVWQYLEWWYLTGCYMEWQELTWWYLEWCYMQWQELTWGYMICESLSGSTNSWTNLNVNEELNNEENITPETNSPACSSSGFGLISPLSWFIVGWAIPFSRQYCSETNSDITIQLLDHNNQRIDIATVQWSSTWIIFDSKLLSTWYSLSWVDYWMYHVISQSLSWEEYYTFTGSYTWTYTDYATGYKIRVIQDSNIIYSPDYTFTIDNKKPTISLISFNVSPMYTGKAYKNSIVELIIESSEVLSWISFMVNDYAGWVTVTQSGNIYRIYQTLSSNNSSWTISYTLQYYDLANNVWSYSNTSSIPFFPTTITTYIHPNTTTWTNTTWIITTNTWTSVVSWTLIEEIVKFNICKKWVSYKEIKLSIHGYTYILQMPEFQKSYVKKIINAFTLVILSDIQSNKSLTKADVNSITNKFNNFLIVLKLVRDDDNKCKQSLSNYHIAEFKKMLSKYDLYSD